VKRATRRFQFLVLRDRAQRLRVLARAALTWERIWPLLWPLAAIVGVALSLALLDILPRLNAWVHALVLAALAGAFAFGVFRFVRGMRRVEERDVTHRIEIDNNLTHRPLLAVEDRLASGADDPMAATLWELHRKRMAAMARNLIVRLPRPGVAGRDPYALRAAVVLLMVVAVAAGMGDYGPRLMRAVAPSLGGPSKPVSLEVWITPPAYTRIAPIFLDKAAQQAPQLLKLPKGSTLLAQVSGTSSQPTLHIGDAKTPFELIGPGDHRVETTIDQGSRLSVEQGSHVLAAWPIEVTLDQPPTVKFSRPPEVSNRTQVRLDYEATDDYGLAKVVAQMRRVGDRAGDAAKPGIEIDMPMPGLGSANAKGRTTRDLTAHPWAGFPVKIRLVATDVGGQSAETEDLELTLPERSFKHPVAQVLIKHRKLLVDPTPDAVDQVEDALERLMASPDLYSNDTTVYLGLKVARSRLDGDPDDETVASVQKMMWDMAIRLEEGQVEMAQRELSKLQDQLRQALRDQLTKDPEIQRLLDEMRRALDTYMQSLMEQLQDMQAFNGQIPPNAKDMNEEIRKMLEEAQKLAEQGDRQGAEQMMEKLQQMLQDMQNQIAKMNPNSPQGRQAAQQRAKAQKAISGLQALTKKQQALIDRTFRQTNGLDAPPRNMRLGVQEAIDQEEMRRSLGSIMMEFEEAFGGIPGNVGTAERAMRESSESLITGLMKDSLHDQADVLKELRKSSNDAQQQMQQQFGGVMVGRAGPGNDPGQMRGNQRGPQPGQPRPGEDRDPFGREQDDAQNHGENVDGDVAIPNEEGHQAQEILDELRRRSADRNRPQSELNYIERLLKQF
jgi:uncharacterized protein (TIGR02302 family)